MGVTAPDDKESEYVLRDPGPSREVMVLLAMLKRRLPLPLNRRSAEKALFMVPIEDSVPGLDILLLPFER